MVEGPSRTSVPRRGALGSAPPGTITSTSASASTDDEHVDD
ncbi:hypothetical protein FHR89_000718 [Cellulomonas uda]|nr:hypothetical protein [Cellulomonas uda]NII65656.1 hypothetical protein [Cellulomonas uda]